MNKYNPQKALQYASTWALGRNPAYYNFDNLGGDCTNFVSQCIYAGTGTMNYTKDTGWYYNHLNDRAPAWAGVEFLYRFLVDNKGAGPVGQLIPLEEAIPGDIIQLSFNGTQFTHSCIIMGVYVSDIIVAQHSYDFVDRPLSTHVYKDIRVLRLS